MKRLLLLLFLFVPSLLIADGLDGCEQHVKYGTPGTNGTLLCRLGYALAHDNDKKVPSWVAYHLTAEKMAGTHPRRDHFRADHDLPSGSRAELSDYSGSGFDRGHMAPAAAMKWSERAMDESFLLSNMAPQVGVSFNRHIWKSLETKVRKWTKERGELYVVTGPIYDDTDNAHIDSPTIGDNAVTVPTHFYKIAFDPVTVEAIAFILPNKKLVTADLPTFITSVDAVEGKTRLDFFSKVVDAVEVQVESAVQESMW